MKVIRRGVFETNSSSTHTLTLANKDSNKRCSFEIISPEGKLVMLMSCIKEAERDFYAYDYNKEQEVFKKEAIDFYIKTIKKYYPDYSLDEKYLNDIIYFSNVALSLNVNVIKEFIEQDGNEDVFNALVSFDEPNDKVNHFMSILLSYYCEMNNIKRETALKRLEEYAIKTRGISCHNNICCQCFYEESSLFECDCGFHTYADILSGLGLDENMTDDELRSFAEKLLSSEYKFVGTEKFGTKMIVSKQKY